MRERVCFVRCTHQTVHSSKQGERHPGKDVKDTLRFDLLETGMLPSSHRFHTSAYMRNLCSSIDGGRLSSWAFSSRCCGRSSSLSRLLTLFQHPAMRFSLTTPQALCLLERQARHGSPHLHRKPTTCSSNWKREMAHRPLGMSVAETSKTESDAFHEDAIGSMM